MENSVHGVHAVNDFNIMGWAGEKRGYGWYTEFSFDQDYLIAELAMKLVQGLDHVPLSDVCAQDSIQSNCLRTCATSLVLIGAQN